MILHNKKEKVINSQALKKLLRNNWDRKRFQISSRREFNKFFQTQRGVVPSGIPWRVMIARHMRLILQNSSSQYPELVKVINEWLCTKKERGNSIKLQSQFGGEKFVIIWISEFLFLLAKFVANQPEIRIINFIHPLRSFLTIYVCKLQEIVLRILGDASLLLKTLKEPSVINETILGKAGLR